MHREIHRLLEPNGLFIIITSRSSAKRLEFMHSLKSSPENRVFQKIMDEKINTSLKDWRDGEGKTARMIILQAKKRRNSKGGKGRKLKA